MRAPAALLLLALAACGAAGPNNVATAPGPGQDENRPAADIVAPAPPQQRSYAPVTAPDPADDSGPRNAFIVCPGNPRCPPTGGSQPKSGLNE